MLASKRGRNDFCCYLQVYYSNVNNINLEIPSRRVPEALSWIQYVYENVILLARGKLPYITFDVVADLGQKYHGSVSQVHTYCF